MEAESPLIGTSLAASLRQTRSCLLVGYGLTLSLQLFVRFGHGELMSLLVSNPGMVRKMLKRSRVL